MSVINFPLFLTKTGSPAESKDFAYYEVDVTGAEGMYKLTRRSTRGPWKTLVRGTLAEVNRIYLEDVGRSNSLPTVKKPVFIAAEEGVVEFNHTACEAKESKDNEESAEVSESSCAEFTTTKSRYPVVSTVWSRIKNRTKMTEKELSDYLWVCLERNRCSDKKAVIHTRLFDSFGQPIYITAHERGEEPSDLNNSHVVDTMAAVKHFEPDCEDAIMPAPIQWSYSPADYVWDASIPVAPLTENSYDHMVKDRVTRIKCDLPELSEDDLLHAIKYSITRGVEAAVIDCTYAIPTYSRKRNAVHMALPLYVPQYSIKEPVAAILFYKNHLGYTPATILSCRMAYLSAMAFRNPDNTWLKECKSL